MKSEFITKAHQVWSTITNSNTADPFELNLQLEAHKKLLSVFQIGNYYYFLFNITEMELEYMSSGVQKTLGYDPLKIRANFLLSRIHPDDQPYFLNFEKSIIDFFANLPIEKFSLYKVQYDYRIQHAKGHYVRILHQSILIDFDENKNLHRSFGLHTDINHIKKDGIPVFSIIGLEDEPSFINIKTPVLSNSVFTLLTAREKEILKLMVEGKTSKEIAALLYVSLHTVNTHRKNMLKKADLKSPTDLLIKAITDGWI